MDRMQLKDLNIKLRVESGKGELLDNIHEDEDADFADIQYLIEQALLEDADYVRVLIIRK